ncbi:helix-turn-helix transcriptional regulator [Paenirhodobacter sp. CAU 1674]|uniref:helix-turn-helix domain-containing protein n=1 Tax=Paenirhodobacter sp. CAU 1674 TaxID=3032596 RepID=UPI0023DC19D2|nr:helix-turn-helix transcriptional regulator [Paenirhodobacter sp. CAU 1674]MDF2140874.1 helix-turn-helix transcriptional regulator [Paenirhodobacter sp. CAU 1674]
MTPAKFRAARQTLGLRQDQLGDALGLSRTTISRIESGSHPIEPRTALTLRAMVILGADPDHWPDRIDPASPII